MNKFTSRPKENRSIVKKTQLLACVQADTRPNAPAARSQMMGYSARNYRIVSALATRNPRYRTFDESQ